MTLDALNRADLAGFVGGLEGVFEGAGWIAERAFEVKPLPTVTALHQALFDEILESPEELQIEFLNLHPELTAAMGQHSPGEQAGLGLDGADAGRFGLMNQAYRARFGFPFMICVRRHTRASVLAQFSRRLRAEPAEELAAALQEVFWISRLRIAARVEGPGMPLVSGGLSTHVLDTARGRAAAGVAVEVFELDEDGGAVRRRSAVTDGDGRVRGLLDDGGPLRIGVYELRFGIGAYFGGDVDPPYLDVVPVRVGVAEAEGHYHVPLLVSPYGYTTFRGS